MTCIKTLLLFCIVLPIYCIDAAAATLSELKATYASASREQGGAQLEALSRQYTNALWRTGREVYKKNTVSPQLGPIEEEIERVETIIAGLTESVAASAQPRGASTISNAVDGVPVAETMVQSTNVQTRFLASIPRDMVLISKGPFIMGQDKPGEKLHREHQFPKARRISVSAFYMDQYEVTKAKWDKVFSWSLANGYEWDKYCRYSGFGKERDKQQSRALGLATNHPVFNISWYDCVKWCNARSEMEGLSPLYYCTGKQKTVYRAGALKLRNACVKWRGDGYRLPTEAEWEKAARAGRDGFRFPWGDTIRHENANYRAYDKRRHERGSGRIPSYRRKYDVSPTKDLHPFYGHGTSAAGSFPPMGSYAHAYLVADENGYAVAKKGGLYDMVGNVGEWCWDIKERHLARNGTTDPKGPDWSHSEFGPHIQRCKRGGTWANFCYSVRCAYRGGMNAESYRNSACDEPLGKCHSRYGCGGYTGFRAVRPAPESIK